jgi:hypothetical protein
VLTTRPERTDSERAAGGVGIPRIGAIIAVERTTRGHYVESTTTWNPRASALAPGATGVRGPRGALSLLVSRGGAARASKRPNLKRVEKGSDCGETR